VKGILAKGLAVLSLSAGVLLGATANAGAPDSRTEVETLLDSLRGCGFEARIDGLWRHFRGRPYQGGTLTPPGEAEELVLRLDVFDCLTWLDHAVALLQADSYRDYHGHLLRNRYYDSEISFETRRHFFTDWLDRDDWYSPRDLQSEQAVKLLNRRAGGGTWVPGIPCRMRRFGWLPSASLSSRQELLRSGDLIGFYTDLPGLDVTHVGLLEVDGDSLFLLHASSAAGKLVRVEFLDYASGKPGVVVLRRQVEIDP